MTHDIVCGVNFDGTCDCGLEAMKTRVAKLEEFICHHVETKIERDRYRDALVWALGAGEDFPLPAGNRPFWWRSELQERAGLVWDGESSIDA